MLVDRFGRPVKGLRVSVTSRCNLNCMYCHMEGITASTVNELSVSELTSVVKVAAKLGVGEVKVTGGEPLVRPDVVDFIKEVSKVDGVSEVSMTTNGVLLEEYAEELKRAGLKRVNVNLCSLKREVYQQVTGKDALEDVIRGVRKAVEVGLTPVKVNMVVLKGLNLEEIPSMMRFTREVGAILQLIELEGAGKANEEFFNKYYTSLIPVEEGLKRSSVRCVTRAMHRRLRFYMGDGAVVEVVRPFHNSTFCLNCHRIRLTPDGKLKPCLMREDDYVDLTPALKPKPDLEKLEQLFLEAVRLREPYWVVAKRG